MNRVLLCLVTWNGEKFIKNCLDSLLAQNYQDFSIQILDNGSMDSTREILARDYPQILVEKKDHNLGFAKAYNQIMLRASSEYVLIVNQDMVFEKDFLGELVKTMDEDEGIGAVGPCLYRLIDSEKSDVFDSLGLRINKKYQVEDDYAGETNIVLPKQFEVFGVSGAATLFRKKALESVRFENEYFDNDFFAYKEDVDLAMRLRLAGWKSMINMNSVAYHYRSGKSDRKQSRIVQYKEKSDFLKLHSFRNHKLFLAKTAQWQKYWWSIFWQELQKSIFVFFFSPKIWWRAKREYRQLKPRILKKRQAILKKIKSRDLSNWIK